MIFNRLSYFFISPKNTLGSMNICKEVSFAFFAQPCPSFGISFVQMISPFLFRISHYGMCLSVYSVVVLSHRLSPQSSCRAIEGKAQEIDDSLWAICILQKNLTHILYVRKICFINLCFLRLQCQPRSVFDYLIDWDNRCSRCCFIQRQNHHKIIAVSHV